MSASKTLSFGLLADTQKQLADLNGVVVEAGFTVKVFVCARDINIQANKPSGIDKVDAWLVCVDRYHDRCLSFVETLDKLQVLVIYDDIRNYAVQESQDRVKRFVNKINSCQVVPPEKVSRRAHEVWVLAASTGGPEAVTDFLKSLPQTLSGVAFIYVQHIDSTILKTLQKAVCRSTTWQVLDCDQAHVIAEGCIYIVSPKRQIDMDTRGVIGPTDKPWLSVYKPSADQVMAKLARIYGSASGAIIFSGMGDDGAKSCRLMKHLGGNIWAQEPESCKVDSMPVEALQTQTVSYVGTPEMLAKKFSGDHSVSSPKKSASNHL